MSIAAGIWGVVVGGILTLLAAPLSVGALIELPAERVSLAIDRKIEPTETALDGLIEMRRTARNWHWQPQGSREIGRLLFRRAHRQGPNNPQYHAGLRKAEQALRRALAIAPVDPYSWAYLAGIVWLDRHDVGLAVAALRASFEVGPYDPYLADWRTRLGLILWPHLELADRLLYLDQMRQLWASDPDALAGLAQSDQVFRLAMAALVDPEQVAALRTRRQELGSRSK